MKILRSRGHRVLMAILVEVREEAGLTQRQLAAKLKESASQVAKMEIGERNVNPAECVAWARACRVEPLEFFRRFVDRLAVG